MVWLDTIRLRSSSPRTRRKAIESLTDAGKLPGRKLLVASLGDPDPQVRCAAAKALGTINEEFSVAARVAALADESSEVRATAATTLREVQDPQRLAPWVRNRARW
jgi:HEAT repeat protein